MWIELIKTARPRQWIKNFFVFAALIFAGDFFNWPLLCKAIMAFISFGLISSAVYFFNDLVDKNRDRQHPIKKNRPVAAGRIGVPSAIIASLILLSVGLAVSFLYLNSAFSLIILIYLLNNIFYSLYFKDVIILDVIMVASGFILRAVGGALAIDVFISPWFLWSVFSLSLFLAASKRRQESMLYFKDQTVKDKTMPGKTMGVYSVQLLNRIIGVSAIATLAIYVLYTFNSGHSLWLIGTIPLVLIGLLRYLHLIYGGQTKGDPTEIIYQDFFLQIDIFLWISAIFFILYYL